MKDTGRLEDEGEVGRVVWVGTGGEVREEVERIAYTPQILLSYFWGRYKMAQLMQGCKCLEAFMEFDEEGSCGDQARSGAIASD